MNLLDKLLGRSTKGTVAWLEAEELSTLLDGQSPPLVIDVRGPDEFAGPLGHIETAQNIPLAQFPVEIEQFLGRSQLVVLVCHTDRRSSAAAEHLRRAGGNAIAVLRGGMVAWRSRPTS
jgi:rhodanese-related sulfurtransferase